MLRFAFVLSIIIMETFPGLVTAGGFSVNNNAKMNCKTNEDCQGFCESVFPGVKPIVGTCASDKASCNCSSESGPNNAPNHNKRVNVRLIQEKPPVPATQAPQLQNQDPDWVPQVLNCNGAEESVAICKAFCQSLSLGGGYCNNEQLTCVCSGVHPSVVQPAPIPAIFNFYLQPRPTVPITPKPSMMNEWRPITSNSHGGSNNNFAGNQQPFQYSNPQMNMNGVSSQSFQQYPQQGLYQMPSNYWSWQQQYSPEYFQQHFANNANSAQTVTSSVSEEKVVSTNNSTEGFPADRAPVSVDESVTSSKSSSPRRKRSAGSSYSNAFALRQA